jgi:hypothetical protein
MLSLRVVLALFDIEGLFYCQNFFLLTCGMLGVAGKGVTDLPSFRRICLGLF